MNEKKNSYRKLRVDNGKIMEMFWEVCGNPECLAYSKTVAYTLSDCNGNIDLLGLYLALN